MWILERLGVLNRRSQSIEISSIVQEDRVLVMGARISGAEALASEFQQFIEGKDLSHVRVELLRDAGFIEHAFFGTTMEEDPGTLQKKSIPLGVILLPEMRQYDERGSGMFLNTYQCGISKYVEGLCRQHGVPLVEIRPAVEEDNQVLIAEGIAQIVLGHK